MPVRIFQIFLYMQWNLDVKHGEGFHFTPLILPETKDDWLQVPLGFGFALGCSS